MVHLCAPVCTEAEGPPTPQPPPPPARQLPASPFPQPLPGVQQLQHYGRQVLAHGQAGQPPVQRVRAVPTEERRGQAAAHVGVGCRTAGEQGRRAPAADAWPCGRRQRWPGQGTRDRASTPQNDRAPDRAWVVFRGKRPGQRSGMGSLVIGVPQPWVRKGVSNGKSGMWVRGVVGVPGLSRKKVMRWSRFRAA